MHSRFFNERGWAASAIALENANKFKRRQAPVEAKVDRLKALRFDAKVEDAKVVNRSDDAKVAEMAGLSKLTVAKLRAVCKARGLKGYSKAKKADLLAMLA
jgi:hypothetical protein